MSNIDGFVVGIGFVIVCGRSLVGLVVFDFVGFINLIIKGCFIGDFLVDW